MTYLTIASTMLGVRRNGTISGRASDNPLSNRQSKSQFIFSAFVVSMRTFSVWRSPRPLGIMKYWWESEWTVIDKYVQRSFVFHSLWVWWKMSPIIHCSRYQAPSTALHSTAQHYTTLHCTTLHSTALHCTALHSTAKHCSTALLALTYDMTNGRPNSRTTRKSCTCF